MRFYSSQPHKNIKPQQKVRKNSLEKNFFFIPPPLLSSSSHNSARASPLFHHYRGQIVSGEIVVDLQNYLNTTISPSSVSGEIVVDLPLNSGKQCSPLFSGEHIPLKIVEIVLTTI